MQAILTKFVPATNTKPSRIKAFCDADSITISFPMEYNNVEHAHRIAAETLRDHLGWNHDDYGDMVCGGLPQGFKHAHYAFVFVTKVS